MKKKILALLTICALAGTTTLTSCKKDKKEETAPGLTMEQKLIGKWTLKTATTTTDMFGNKNTLTTTFTPADYFEFNSNGTVSIMEGSNAYSGKWKVEKDKLYFSDTNYIDYSTGFTVPVLNSSDLQLYYMESNTFQTTEQKLILSK